MLKKKFSQHLIKDKNLIKKIVNATDIGKEDTVIEIGAGQGDLTEYIAKKARYVYAIEVDKGFKENLQAIGKRHENISIIYNDVLKIPFTNLCKTERCKIIGNIPYNITGPILFKTLKERESIESAYFTIQKEVALRIISPHGKRIYGALSAIVQLLSRAKILFYMKPSVFIPPPRVESAFISMDFKGEAKELPDGLIDFINICFRNKRKFMKYALIKHFGREKTENLYNHMGFPRSIRAENIVPHLFLEMYRYMEQV